MGDFNLNLFDSPSCQSVNAFLDLCMVRSIYPLIHSPTRVTDNTATLLDNIFTNNLENAFSGVILADVSDHFPIFSISDFQVRNKAHTFCKREINNENTERFITEISNICWTVESADANKAYNDFLNKFLHIYDSCFLVKEMTSKTNKNKQWFTKSLHKLCSKKHILYKKYLKNPTEYRHKKYKELRNTVTVEIKKAKILILKENLNMQLET